MALDHPDAVERVCFLDIVPTHHMMTNIKRQWAVDSYHWFFMAQPHDYPEKMIEAYGFERYIRRKLDKPGVGLSGFTPEAMAEYIRCCNAANIHAVCEDYRAAVGIDLVHDEADLHVKIPMPMLVLWGEKSHVNRSYKPIEAWRERAADVRGKMLPCGHYPRSRFPTKRTASWSRSSASRCATNILNAQCDGRRWHRCAPLPGGHRNPRRAGSIASASSREAAPRRRSTPPASSPRPASSTRTPTTIA
jgi:hypothetical protein